MDLLASERAHVLMVFKGMSKIVFINQVDRKEIEYHLLVRKYWQTLKMGNRLNLQKLNKNRKKLVAEGVVKGAIE